MDRDEVLDGRFFAGFTPVAEMNPPNPGTIFLKDILVIWSELNYQVSIETVEAFLAQSLWYNSLIRVMNKPVFYKSWYNMGISHVKQIVKEQPCTFLSPTEFESKYHTKVCPLTLYGMTSTLRELWKNKNH